MHHLSDSKDLAYIHVFLTNPGREYTPTEVHEQVHGRRDEPPSSPTVAADVHTVREYMQRIHDLHARLDAIDGGENPNQRQRLEEELDALEIALCRTVSASGRQRRVSQERARKAVTNAIYRTLQKLKHAHPVLAAHLKDSLRIGHRICYAPQERMTWLT